MITPTFYPDKTSKPLVFKRLVLGFLLLLSFTAYSQNYSTIIPFSETYFVQKPFQNNSKHQAVLATRFDSMAVIDKAEHYFSFKSLRSYRADGDYDPSPGNCDFYVGHSWTGPKVVRDSNGWDYLFNDSFERISIHRSAKFNDTFLMYTYPSGEQIHAIVTAQYWDQILGKSQRVKVLTLISNLPGFPNHEISFSLSEYFGWIKWFKPAHFPLNLKKDFDDYLYLKGYVKDSTRIGLTRLTWRDVYDFQPGDVFLRERGYDHPDRHTWVITERNDFPSLDAVEYKAIKLHHWYEYVSADNYTYKRYDTTEVSMYYDELSNFVTDVLPDELILDSSGGSAPYFKSSTGHSISLVRCGNFEYVIQTMGSNFPGNCSFLEYRSDSCIDFYFGVGPLSEYGSGTYAQGLGNIGNGDYRLSSFHKTGTNCGNPSPLSVVELEEEPLPYPNPSAGIFTIPQVDVKSIELISSTGTVISGYQFSSNKLDLNDLPDGVYHVLLYSSKGVSRHRIVKINP